MESLALLLAIYFVPTLVALARKHRQHLAIGILNLFAGWTVIGWVGALVWACTTDVENPKGPRPSPLEMPVGPAPAFVASHWDRLKAKKDWS